MKLANLVGPILINRFVGAIAGRLTGQRIPYRGLIIDTSSPLITDNSRAALLWRSYERAEFAFVDRYLPGDCEAIEFGSSIGVMSSVIARRLAKSYSLRAVEADPRLVPLLEANVALNGVANRVSVINAALGYGSETLEFGIGETNVGGSLSRSSVAQTITVKTTSLSEILGDPDRPFSLVSDIEGAEWDLFEREGDWLARARIIIMELHDRGDGGSANTWRDLLTQLGRDKRFEVIDSYGPVVVFKGLAAQYG